MARAKSKNRLVSSNGQHEEDVLINEPERVVEIPPMDIRTCRFKIIPITPLIINNFSTRKIADIKSKRDKDAKGQEPDLPAEQEMEEAKHISLDGWEGAPASAFKHALVNAGVQIPSLSKTAVRRSIFILADGQDQFGRDLVQIHGKSELNSQMGRTTSGMPKPCHRPMYRDYYIILNIEYNAELISEKQIAALLIRGGYSEGICDQRPSAPKNSSGTFGRFRIASE